MNRAHKVNPLTHSASLDMFVFNLRKDGYCAWIETDGTDTLLITNAGRGEISMSCGSSCWLEFSASSPVYNGTIPPAPLVPSYNEADWQNSL